MSVIDAIKDAMQNNHSRKTIFVFGAIVILIAILVIVTYFFYNTDSNYDDNIDFVAVEAVTQPQTNTETQNNTESTNNVESKNMQSQTNTEANVANTTNSQIDTSLEPNLKAIAQNVETTTTISQLKYAIKPLDKNIASCNIMKNGKWNMPNSCKDEVLNAIKTLISTNSEIIAIEVSGVVDNNPYSGPTAELKQEGLASFRAREAIGVITRGFSNIAVFEGLSIQAPNKRGFEVKAYYLQN